MNKFILGAFLIGLTASPLSAADIQTSSPKGHEAVKASVVNSEPATYTINVKSLSNPETCGNFENTPLTYKKPEKYLREFDLSGNPEIVTAINEYKCVIVPNKPM
jgi:hypothetical protein